MTIESTSLLGLEKQNLRDQAVVALRQAITSGELPPGTHLGEVELSERLGISRGTLRDALRELKQEGLVVLRGRGRLAVRTLAPTEIREVFQVRAALESLAAELVIESDDVDSELASLRTALDGMRRVAASDLPERIESDLDFHRALCVLAGNATLLASWHALEGTIRMSVMYNGLDRGIENMSVERHLEIVEAIESGDAAAARAAIHDHMRVSAENLTRRGPDDEG